MMAGILETYERAFEVLTVRFNDGRHSVAKLTRGRLRSLVSGDLAQESPHLLVWVDPIEGFDIDVHIYDDGTVSVATGDTWVNKAELLALPRFPDFDTAMAYWELAHER